MNNKVLEKSKKSGLYQEQFDSLMAKLTDLFQLSYQDSEKLKQNKIAHIIGKLPYLANCNNPERMALSHLAITYMAAHEACKDTFNHNSTDDVDLLKRLERINHFDGGDKNIIKMGMNLLAIIMLNDHLEDSQIDIDNCKYNPYNSRVWNIKEMLQELKSENDDLITRGIDSIYSVEEIMNEYWEFP